MEFYLGGKIIWGSGFDAKYAHYMHIIEYEKEDYGLSCIASNLFMQNFIVSDPTPHTPNINLLLPIKVYDISV